MGVLDRALLYSIEEFIIGLISVVAFLANMIAINVFFGLFVVFLIFLLVLIYHYLRPLILRCKQLDLKMKTPILAKLDEMIHGLISIQLFQETQHYLRRVYQNINESTQANIYVWFCCRITTILSDVIVFLVIVSLLFLGVSAIPLGPNEYSVNVIFMFNLLGHVGWVTFNMIQTESQMVSAARCHNFNSLPQ